MASDPSKSRRRWLSKWLGSLVIAALLGWFVTSGGVPLVPSKAQFRWVTPSAIPIYIALLLVAHFFRASRWRYLIAPIKRIGLKDTLALNWIGFFCIFLFPFRIGELARPALSKLRHGVPVSAGLGTVAVERVIDGLITSLCVAWAIYSVPASQTKDPLARHLPFYGSLALVVFTVALLVLAWCVWQHDRALALASRYLRPLSPKFADQVIEKIDNLFRGFHSLRNWRLCTGFLSETCVYWLMSAISMWWLAVGCGVYITLGQAVATMGILALGVLLPAGPGLFGNFQLAVSTALRLFLIEGVVREQGAVFIFLLYIIQASILAVLGLVPAIAMGLKPGDVLNLKPVSLEPPPAK